MEPAALRVLLVEDDPEDHLLLGHVLAEVPSFRVQLECVQTLEAARAAIADARHDVYLIDYFLGPRHGIELLHEALAHGLKAPALLLTGDKDPHLVGEALQAGAADYLCKSEITPALLDRTLCYALSRHHTLEELRNKNAHLENLSRSKSEFLANMSHELRTPLNCIIGFTELLHDAKAGSVSEQQREFLGDILTSAQHLLSLIGGVLDLAKVEAGKIEFQPEKTDLGEVVRTTVQLNRPLADAKRITIQCTVAPELNAVMIDPSRFRQVLFNYLSNALKFTPEGGSIQVRAVPHGEGQLRLDVEDSGVGIAEHDQERLFQSFEQLDPGTNKRYQGTGLGLALTKRLVEAQGGRVELRSTLGQGSVFSAILPR